MKGLLIIIIILQALPLVLSMIGPKPLKALNFENDMVFLNFLIGTKVQHYNKYVILPAKAAGIALMTDEDLIKYRDGYVVEIYAHINEDYKRVLLKYFSEEGLRFYIISTLNDEITNGILSHNMKFFNKKPSDNSFNNIRAVDM